MLTQDPIGYNQTLVIFIRYRANANTSDLKYVYVKKKRTIYREHELNL